jgi:hypothetical protein
MKMKKMKGKVKIPAHLAARLEGLESKAAGMGLSIHYDLMEAAGLKLNGGLCTIRGAPHLFIDRRASAAERIAAIENCIEKFNAGDFLEAVKENKRPDADEIGK